MDEVVEKPVIEFPKWVKVDDSHIVMQNGNATVPLFSECHVDRVTKVVSVLVKNTDEEKLAMSAKELDPPETEIQPETKE